MLRMLPSGSLMLPTGSERLVEYLLTQGRITTAEARQILDVSVNTARRYLTILMEAGYLEHARKSVRDPHGYWQMTAGP